MSQLNYNDHVCETPAVLSGDEEKTCDEQNVGRDCYSVKFYLSPVLSPFARVEQRCLAVLRQPAPVSVYGCVLYCRAALTLHRYIRSKIEGVCSSASVHSPKEKCRIAHSFILKSLRLSYGVRLGREYRNIVSALIGEIFYCEQDLGFIFRFLGKSPAQDIDCDILYPDLTVQGDNQRALHAMEYYMTYIDIEPSNNECDSEDCVFISRPSRKSHTWPNYLNCPHNFSKTDLPLQLAAASANANGLLTLLRYGANPFIRSRPQCYDGTLQKPGESTLSILTSSLNCLAFAKRVCQVTPGPLEILRKEEDRIIQCLLFVRRSVRSLPLISSDTVQAMRLWNYSDHSGSQVTILAEFWPKLAELGLVGVPRLQHLARCAIRDQLSRVRKRGRTTLPDLITSLPVPGRMKSYIGLYHD